ncbi:MAG: hypothetical protein E7012_04045 [Alphaproteobacteria bacterium]|nr:hypothetical protein [Alphaproteobacteria bacterium]
MKKMLLSLLASTIYTSVVSAQTCQQPPSCESLGYTKSVDDCGDIEYLTCPFDSSKVYCSGGSGDGEADGETDSDTIELLFYSVPSGKTITFTYGGGSIEVDCGNGNIVTGTATDTGTVKCKYTESGNAYVTIRGDFTYYGGSSTTVSAIFKLNKKGITKITKLCNEGSEINDVIYSSTLIDASSMYEKCYLQSASRTLPKNLEIGDKMFYSSEYINFDAGYIKIPMSLKSAYRMFRGTEISGIVEFPPNSQLENAKEMFYGVSSGMDFFNIIGLENTKITDGSYMFYQNYSLRTIPSLPTTLTNANKMFYNCENMTGTLPDYSNFPNLTNVTDMFYGTQITQEDNPSWPASAW